MVKLYNFNAIEAWPPPCPERLHGGVITYRPGYGEHSVRALHHELDWDRTPLRCLHLCFTHRSSLDLRRGEKVRIRKGVGETKHWGFNLRSWVLSLFGREDIPYFKRDYYMRGPLVEKDIRPFRLDGVRRTPRRQREGRVMARPIRVCLTRVRLRAPGGADGEEGPSRAPAHG